MRAILTVARNTMLETVRQNVYGLLLVLSALLIIMSPTFAMFTFLDSTKLVQDMGLATILLAGLLLSALCAAAVVTREVEGRTALTVLSKPISRIEFILGKYFGLAGAIALATYILGIILMLTYRFGVKDAAYTKLDWGSLIGMLLAILIAILIAAFFNYFFNRPFVTIAVWAVAATLTVALLFFCIYAFEKDRSSYVYHGFGAGVNWQIAIAAFLVLQAVLILTAVAVAMSTRFRVAASLTACGIFFFGGMLSEFFFGTLQRTSVLARLAYTALPNMQIYWVTEAMVEGKTIPGEYVWRASAYSFFYAVAILLVGMFLFARREISE